MGAGRGVSLTVSAEQIMSVPNSLYDYDPPLVAYISPEDGYNTRGGDNVGVYGINFGPGALRVAADYTPDNTKAETDTRRLLPYRNVSIGGMWCTQIIPVNDVSIFCATPERVGKDLDVLVFIENQDSGSTGDRMLTYEPPQVSTVTPSVNADQAGRQQMIIFGDFLGPLRYIPKIYVGPGGCHHSREATEPPGCDLFNENDDGTKSPNPNCKALGYMENYCKSKWGIRGVSEKLLRDPLTGELDLDDESGNPSGEMVSAEDLWQGAEERGGACENVEIRIAHVMLQCLYPAGRGFELDVIATSGNQSSAPNEYARMSYVDLSGQRTVNATMELEVNKTGMGIVYKWDENKSYKIPVMEPMCDHSFVDELGNAYSGNIWSGYYANDPELRGEGVPEEDDLAWKGRTIFTPTNTRSIEVMSVEKFVPKCGLYHSGVRHDFILGVGDWVQSLGEAVSLAPVEAIIEGNIPMPSEDMHLLDDSIVLCNYEQMRMYGLEPGEAYKWAQDSSRDAVSNHDFMMPSFAGCTNPTAYQQFTLTVKATGEFEAGKILGYWKNITLYPTVLDYVNRYMCGCYNPETNSIWDDDWVLDCDHCAITNIWGIRVSERPEVYCPPGQQIIKGVLAYQCQNCPVGMYADKKDLHKCMACPVGSDCKIAGTERPMTTKGFWRKNFRSDYDDEVTNKKFNFLKSPYQKSRELDFADTYGTPEGYKYYTCPNDLACIGTANSTCQYGHLQGSPVCGVCCDQMAWPNLCNDEQLYGQDLGSGGSWYLMTMGVCMRCEQTGTPVFNMSKSNRSGDMKAPPFPTSCCHT